MNNTSRLHPFDLWRMLNKRGVHLSQDEAVSMTERLKAGNIVRVPGFKIKREGGDYCRIYNLHK